MSLVLKLSLLAVVILLLVNLSHASCKRDVLQCDSELRLCGVQIRHKNKGLETGRVILSGESRFYQDEKLTYNEFNKYSQPEGGRCVEFNPGFAKLKIGLLNRNSVKMPFMKLDKVFRKSTQTLRPWGRKGYSKKLSTRFSTLTYEVKLEIELSYFACRKTTPFWYRGTCEAIDKIGDNVWFTQVKHKTLHQPSLKETETQKLLGFKLTDLNNDSKK